MTETERAWLAGLMEGEGWFGVSKTGTPQTTLGMTDEDIVRRAHAVANIGSFYGPRAIPGQKDRFTWQLQKGHEAAALMLVLYPYLGRRRQAKIREVVTPWIERPHAGLGSGHRRKTHCPSGHPYDDENTRTYMRPNGWAIRRCRACEKDRKVA